MSSEVPLAAEEYSQSDDDEFFECDILSLKNIEKNLDDGTPGYDLNNSEELKNDIYKKHSNGNGTTHTSHSANNVIKAMNGVTHSKWGGRTKLPVPMPSTNDIGLWSILKQCIGKELSKITMPVVFNEPLSFLQRVVEYMEYAELIEKASNCNDPVERLEYIAAFAASAAASNWERVGKPFNPLLGETYELERSDLPYRIMAEQVSHHPPVSAFHADSPTFTFHGAIHPKLKFWGKYIEVTPKGVVTLHLLKHNEIYTWQNVNCCVHNIIVGKVWLELSGVMEIVNEKTKMKAEINFRKAGWFGRDLHKIDGYIYTKDKQKLRAFYGKWTEALYSHNVIEWENYVKNKAKSSDSLHSLDSSQSDADAESLPAGTEQTSRLSTCNLNLPSQKLLWCTNPRSPDAKLYYNFSQFAMMLNELNDEFIKKPLPPTDCRLRPDMRLMEEGNLDGAAEAKNKVEEKQRASRKERKRADKDWNPKWFTLYTNKHSGQEDWLFTGDYWKRNWSQCPDIF